MRNWVRIRNAIVLALSVYASMANADSQFFDWDGTIMNVKTPVYVYEKGTHREVILDPIEFRSVEHQVGKPGPWENFEFILDEKHPLLSHRRARSYGDNYFLEDMVQALDHTSPKEWQGPAWQSFVASLKDCASAKHAHVLSARGHSAAHVLEALAVLKSRGAIGCLPPPENIHMRSDFSKNPRSVAEYSVAEYKKDVLSQAMDREPSGGKVTFYEDTPVNATQATEGIAAQSSGVKQTAWKDKSLKVVFGQNGKIDVRVTVKNGEVRYQKGLSQGRCGVAEAVRMILGTPSG